MRLRIALLSLVLSVAAAGSGGAFAVAPSIAVAQDHEGAEGEGDAEAEAEGEHGHATGLAGILTNTQFLAAVINFALLLLILRKLGAKPLSEFLVTRRKQMERDMTAAAEMKATAEAKFQEYSKRLEQLDQDLVKLRSDIERGAQEDKLRIAAEGEESMRRLRQETEGVIEQYSKALSATVRREMVDAAVSAAEKILRDNIGDADQQRLAARFDQDVRGSNASRSAP